MNLLSMLAGGLRAPGVGESLGMLADVGADAGALVPAGLERPTILEPLFRSVGARHKLPAELLAGVAAVLTHYNPNHREPGRVGLLSAKAAADVPVADYLANAAELRAGDKDAAARVAAGVELAAFQIADCIARKGIVRGLIEYTGSEYRAMLALSLALVYMAANVDAARWSQLRGMLA